MQKTARAGKESKRFFPMERILAADVNNSSLANSCLLFALRRHGTRLSWTCQWVRCWKKSPRACCSKCAFCFGVYAKWRKMHCYGVSKPAMRRMVKMEMRKMPLAANQTSKNGVIESAGFCQARHAHHFQTCVCSACIHALRTKSMSRRLHQDAGPQQRAHSAHTRQLSRPRPENFEGARRAVPQTRLTP